MHSEVGVRELLDGIDESWDCHLLRARKLKALASETPISDHDVEWLCDRSNEAPRVYWPTGSIQFVENVLKKYDDNQDKVLTEAARDRQTAGSAHALLQQKVIDHALAVLQARLQEQTGMSNSTTP